jgi:outer membrane receptor protein involved in Fe transport
MFAQNSTIKGKVLDAITHTPLEYASISLLKKDSTLFQGTATDKTGGFSFKVTNNRDLVLKVQFVGYRHFDTLLISDGTQKEILLPDILLFPFRSSLQEVTIEGKRANNTIQLNKQLIQAKQFANAANGTGLDLVQRLPSVTVNTEGNVLLRGNSNFLVLINGKFTNRTPAEVLAQIPANAIESIEMVTTPSASYDAEGKAGVINIITKKNVLKGWSITGNGMFGGVDPLRLAGDISINYASAKWNSFISADVRQFNINGYRIGEVRTVFKDTLTFEPSNGIRPLKDKQYGVRAGTTYTPNTSNTINVGAYYGYKQNDRTANLHYKEYVQTTPPFYMGNQTWGTPYKTFYNQNVFVRTGNFFTINADYVHSFKNKSKLTFLGVYEYSVLGGPLRNQDNDEVNGILLLQERSDERSPLNGWRLQTDYSIPLKNKSKIEMGYQWRYVRHRGDFNFERLNINNGIWEKDPDFNDQLDLKQFIHAAYLQYAGQHKIFSYNIGLRGEYMNRNFNHTLGTAPFKIEQVNLFPSAQGLWTLPDNQKLRIGYSKRIDRPTTRLMSPFMNHRHSEFIEVGDPGLLPEITNVAELSYSKNWKRISITATAYFNKVKDKIFRVNEVYSRITLLRTFTNAGSTTSAGLEFSSEIKPLTWIRFYISGNLYQLHVNGIVKGIDINQTSFNYNFNGNTSVDISKKLKFQLDENYVSKTITAQGEDGELFLANAGLRYLWSSKFTAGLLLQNIFNSNHQTITNKGADFYVTTNYIKYDRVLQLSLSFRLNDNGKKGKAVKTDYGEKDF